MNRSRPLQKPTSSQNSEKKLNAGIPTLIYLSTAQLLPRTQETLEEEWVTRYKGQRTRTFAVRL